ncbi:MAG: peptidoglycan recognition protein family protein [Planctomycetota bacterium]|jgi:hypothetical protein
MIKRALVFCSFLLVLGGCGFDNEPMPEIVYSPLSEPKPVPPKPVTPKPDRKSVYTNIPREWLPPSGVEKRWTAIVIHHSATDKGNAAIFDKMHREVNHWEGIGYDFLIGNGTNSGDGQVEVTFRWRRQIAGAHCGGTPANWANTDAVGICLVGNFNYSVPTTRQMQSLLKLVRFLQKRYGISDRRIYGHGTTPGARITDCPGTKFPLSRLKSRINF